jgi:hypothetical protein
VTRARLGALLVLLALAVPVPEAVSGHALTQDSDQVPPEQVAFVVTVPGVSFEGLLGIPDVASLARAGGAALLVDAEDAVTFHERALPGEKRFVLDPVEGELRAIVDRYPSLAGSPEVDDLLLIVLGTDPQDETPTPHLTGIVVARGHPDELFPESGAQGSLSSDSTRRDGVVIGRDVAPTIDAFLPGGSRVWGELPTGEPIRIVHGPPPFWRVPDSQRSPSWPGVAPCPNSGNASPGGWPSRCRCSRSGSSLRGTSRSSRTRPPSR